MCLRPALRAPAPAESEARPMRTPLTAGREEAIASSPAYHDTQLRGLMKELRAAVKPYPHAKIALERVEARLKYTLRVVESWDSAHADKAELLIGLGQIAAANSATQLIFDREKRIALLRRCLIGGDAQAAERMAEAVELDREVLL